MIPGPLRRRWPSDGVWLLITLFALGLVVAIPGAAWTALEAATYRGAG
jgi:hypothetical protein